MDLALVTLGNADKFARFPFGAFRLSIRDALDGDARNESRDQSERTANPGNVPPMEMPVQIDRVVA
jgi:hypothetical protein